MVVNNGEFSVCVESYVFAWRSSGREHICRLQQGDTNTSTQNFDPSTGMQITERKRFFIFPLNCYEAELEIGPQ